MIHAAESYSLAVLENLVHFNLGELPPRLIVVQLRVPATVSREVLRPERLAGWQHLARRANAEDGCTGRFWEGRFKSQALLDEAGLLTAMAYVDLNPIRAGIVSTPEASEFTSIYVRIKTLRRPQDPQRCRVETNDPSPLTPPLLRFCDEVSGDQPRIEFSLHDYLALVDWTGRAIRDDKRGAIDAQLPAIAQRLNIDAEAWQRAMQLRGNVFGRALGQLDHLRLHAKALGQSWVRGLQQARWLYR